MAKVEIYTSPLCGFCYAAKRLLDSKGVEYEEFDVMFKPSLKQEMLARSEGRHTVPQIFIDDTGIGGCDELHQLEASGELNNLLRAGQ
ncbi:MAG: glutaredoxin 3 [Pseudomonadota bacterium]|nr:glutaredoxin 3 [Pseudomonadota bacterium]MEC8198556.1 glutaredoxin 3 [Pseudomonadota bacterium]